MNPNSHSNWSVPRRVRKNSKLKLSHLVFATQKYFTMIWMSQYSVEGMYDDHAFLCMKNTYTTCTMALRYFNCSCRLNSTLMYGWMSHQRSFECWFKAVQS